MHFGAFAAAIGVLTLAARVSGSHRSNWAVLVCTSRYWFNYRHVANTLSMYHTVKQLGIPDEQIILMLADDMPCNSRNSFPGAVYNGRLHDLDLYGSEVQVDYRGDEVTVDNFLRLLTGRAMAGLPPSKLLRTDAHSNVLVYLSGHGGDQFLKFQDAEEVSDHDIAAAVAEMHAKGRFHEMLLLVDTCQAGTLFNEIATPNVLCIGSSARGENSYAHQSDPSLGLAVMDRFTAATLDFFEARRPVSGGGSSSGGGGGGFKGAAAGAAASLASLLRTFVPAQLRSTPVFVAPQWKRALAEVPVTDFFGSVLRIELLADTYNFTGAREDNAEYG